MTCPLGALWAFRPEVGTKTDDSTEQARVGEEYKHMLVELLSDVDATGSQQSSQWISRLGVTEAWGSFMPRAARARARARSPGPGPGLGVGVGVSTDCDTRGSQLDLAAEGGCSGV